MRAGGLLAVVGIAGLATFGVWMVRTSKESLTVEGSHVVLHARSGLRLGRFGQSNTFVARWPVLANTSGFQQDIARQLETFAKEEGLSFTQLPLSDWLDAVRMPSASYQLESDLTCGAALVSDEFASLLCTNWAYTGGAHGNTTYNALNFRAQDGHALPVELPDLFDPQSNWERRLAEACLNDLRRQEASDVVSGSITNLTAADLAAFTVTARGLEFHFDPYAVGAYAEGAFTVHVPWSAIRDCVPTNGCVARWAHAVTAGETR